MIDHQKRIESIRKEIIDFCYGKFGCWKGYDRFFTPTIPNRIGKIILDCVYVLDIIHIQILIGILTNTHKKNIHCHKTGKLLNTTICTPTDDARQLSNLLKQLEQEMTCLYL